MQSSNHRVGVRLCSILVCPPRQKTRNVESLSSLKHVDSHSSALSTMYDSRLSTRATTCHIGEERSPWGCQSQVFLGGYKVERDVYQGGEGYKGEIYEPTTIAGVYRKVVECFRKGAHITKQGVEGKHSLMGLQV